MAPQLTAEEFFVAAGKPVEQCVEMGRVVVVDGVAEFVQQYEVAQMRGKVIRKRLSDRLLSPVQQPHLERDARIVTRP